MGKIYIQKLTLNGRKKNYSINFRRGLNYISGPTSTGKSSIVELINYALGSEDHKDYIEIGNSCTDVELEITLGNKLFKIVRPLFDFDRPVKLFEYLESEMKYSNEFKLLPIDSPANEDSLSRFLLAQLGFIDIKVVNQNFSFRDIFKFCYLKQTEIDNEDIMKEKNWGPSIKRKPTFEIIFNIFDSMLSEIKAKIKEQGEKISDLEKRRQGVFEFLKNLNMLDLETYRKKKNELELYIAELQGDIYSLKSNRKQLGIPGAEIEESIIKRQIEINKLKKDILEQAQYIEKLTLLRNQYRNEVEKIDFLLEGSITLNRYKFEVCPSCLNELVPHEGGCELCGSILQNLSEEEQRVYKSESNRLKLRFNKLSTFIIDQNETVRDLEFKKINEESLLVNEQNTLNHLRMEYISPYIEEIEKLNMQLGENKNQLKELEQTLRIINEFHFMLHKLQGENAILNGLKQQVRDIESSNMDKDTVINKVSRVYEEILKAFNFPKLSNAYISAKDYLPYIRGKKYSQIGSLGSVTMLTMAYYLSVLIVGTEEKFKHPGLLIIDTPRKNLGADPKDEAVFKDERIYNSIIQFFLKLDKEKKHQIQLIVINNGYPDFLSDEYIVAKFDGDGTKGLPYGLIDDAENEN